MTSYIFSLKYITTLPYMTALHSMKFMVIVSNTFFSPGFEVSAPKFAQIKIM
jgi:hypothetical protein